MYTSNISELKNAIANGLFNDKIQKKLNLSNEFIIKHIESPYYIEKIQYMVEKNDYSCGAVLNLCLTMLQELAGENAPSDWLNLFYNFALKKSFPEAADDTSFENLDTPCNLYLYILRIVSYYQRTKDDGTWLSRYPMKFLTSEELKELEYSGEYKRFIQAFSEDYIYEMMKLSQEVRGYNTLDHICGVHYLALFIARQLKKLRLPLDLGRISGAAAGHDIGKYGCKGAELKRVPYLHYYYTDQWFKNMI